MSIWIGVATIIATFAFLIYYALREAQMKLMDVVLVPFLLIGAFVLALWLISVRLYDLCLDIRDYLAGRNKRCDKATAERRPRRAF